MARSVVKRAVASRHDLATCIHPLLGDALLAGAAMDRLLHNTHVVTMDGDTYRNPPPARRARQQHPRRGGMSASDPIRLPPPVRSEYPPVDAVPRHHAAQ